MTIYPPAFSSLFVHKTAKVCSGKTQSHKHAGLNSVFPGSRESQAVAGCEGQLSVMVPGRGVGSCWTLRVGLLRSLWEAVSRGSSQKHRLLCWLNLKAISRHRGQSLSAKTCHMHMILKIFIYSFIWLHRVLLQHAEFSLQHPGFSLVVVYGLSGTRGLSCSMACGHVGS